MQIEFFCKYSRMVRRSIVVVIGCCYCLLFSAAVDHVLDWTLRWWCWWCWWRRWCLTIKIVVSYKAGHVGWCCFVYFFLIDFEFCFVNAQENAEGRCSALLTSDLGFVEFLYHFYFVNFMYLGWDGMNGWLCGCVFLCLIINDLYL